MLYFNSFEILNQSFKFTDESSSKKETFFISIRNSPVSISKKMFSSRSNLSSLSKQNMELEKRRKEAVFLGALENRKQVKQISIVKSVGSEIDGRFNNIDYQEVKL